MRDPKHEYPATGEIATLLLNVQSECRENGKNKGGARKVSLNVFLL